MRSKEVREKFLKYFEGQGHKILPGSSLIPKDPTVLLTLAGMLQFKPVFLGIESARFNKVATVQKCVRTNDIENVGHTARHQTFFEMLGNFSFGDYFKREAIKFAWELVTKEYNIDSSRLYIAVYEKDDESMQIWKMDIGIKTDKIFKLGEDNNFWAAGPTGPCGPCSEIYYDLGEKFGCGKKDCSPNCECGRFLEIWNLVFMEFNRNEKGGLSPLPKKNIDTGMGLERITSILQGVASNFETDLFIPIIGAAKKMTEEKNKINEISLRIISDHVRAAVHLISDGLVPQNEGRNYILRRIIRRAMLHGKKIGIEKPFLHKLSLAAIESAKDFYPDLAGNRAHITQTLLAEEENFLKTLETGSAILHDMISSSKEIISGVDAFKLYDTYGFPVELTREIVSEKGLKIDETGFDKEMQKQKTRSREGSSKQYSLGVVPQVKGFPPTDFVGYDALETEAKVLGVVDGFIILDKTPFYAESGGQISDSGHLIIEKNRFPIKLLFKTAEDVVLHSITGDILPAVGEKVRAEVDVENRLMTAAHHTSTHLLHSALKKILGDHVRQKGSFVAGDRLRFDFIHNEKMSDDEIKKVEGLVNEAIAGKIAIKTILASFDAAKAMGATALFDEKYKDKVRIVKVENVSTELCGGTHVKNTKDIGLFKIMRESAIAQGVRRIEAVSGKPAEIFIKELENERIKQMEIEEKRINDKKNEKIQEKEIRSEAGKPETFKNAISLMIFENSGYAPKIVASYAREKAKDNPNKASIYVSGTTIAVTSGTNTDGGKIDSLSILKNSFNEIPGKGGGNKDFAQGKFNAPLNKEQSTRLRSVLEKHLNIIKENT